MTACAAPAEMFFLDSRSQQVVNWWKSNNREPFPRMLLVDSRQYCPQRQTGGHAHASVSKRGKKKKAVRMSHWWVCRGKCNFAVLCLFIWIQVFSCWLRNDAILSQKCGLNKVQANLFMADPGFFMSPSIIPKLLFISSLQSLITLNILNILHNEVVAVIVTWFLGLFPFGIGYDRASSVIIQQIRTQQHFLQLCSSKRDSFYIVESRLNSPPASLPAPLCFLWNWPSSHSLGLLSCLTFTAFCFSPAPQVYESSHVNLLSLITPPTTKRAIEYCDMKC